MSSRISHKLSDPGALVSISKVEADLGTLQEKLRRGFVGTSLGVGLRTRSSLCWRSAICGVR